MSSSKYILIDKNIIQENVQFQFDIYTVSDTKQEMLLFKKKASLITKEEKLKADTFAGLYVFEHEHDEYRFFYNSLTKLEDISATKIISKENFNQHASAVYNNASEILNTFFTDPDSLGNYDAAKGIVNDIVEAILHDNSTMKSLMSIATHDYYTHTHSINVSIYSVSLGSFLKLSKSELSKLGESALLHDIGKSKIAIEIINKNGKLTHDEFEQIKKHPSFGYTIGLKLGIRDRDILDGIKYHHEKMNGTGYPLKLAGEKIPLFARIIAICDVFDALTTRRSYKEPMSSFDALKLMKTEMKNHLDDTLINKMIMMLRV